MKDLFSKLKRDVSKFPWGAAMSMMAEELHGVNRAQGGTAGEALAQLREWASYLTANALRNWPETIALRQNCDSPDISTGKPQKCRSTAVVVCDVCARKCCLAHARIDYLGGAICEVCIGEAKAAARAKAPKPEPLTNDKDLAKAYRILAVAKNASWEEIRTAYKKLVVQHTPDRPQTERMRAKNTDRMKKLNWAFEVVRAHFESKKQEAA